MSTLRVVEGKLSNRYNHFRDYEYSYCEVTNTRLMGVIAMRVIWIGKDNPRDRLYQVIHLDYSEYGVDDYFEYECVHGKDDYKEKLDEMNYRWDSFVRVMGGDVILIQPEVMIGLIDSAIPLADSRREREYDTEENAEFRSNTLIRFELMREAIDDAHLLKEKCNDIEVIRITSPAKLATCETINYFIMRLIDQDYVAASYLSTIPIEELKQCRLTNQGIQTLVKNKIVKSTEAEDVPTDGTSYPYRCRMTTLGQAGYYYCTLVIYLSGNYKQRDNKVTEISIGSINKLSEYEAAVQLQITEYITVFDCRDSMLRDFDGGRIEYLRGVEPQLVNNGWLYTVYNSDNSHVNRANYWLNDDVYGYAILTIDGELVLMSNKLHNISYMDEATAISMYAPFMELDGRYQLATPIFKTFCDTYGVMFRQLIDYPDND